MQTVPLGAGGAIPRLLSFQGRPSARGLVAMLLACGLSLAAATACAEQSSATGPASWYGDEFAHRQTASGERYDPGKMTGAHRTFPLGSKVRVTNLTNGRSVLVTINDRGPYHNRRVIDLSYGAARALGMIRRGVARVRVELVDS